MGLNWESIFTTDMLERLGAGCGSLDELATAIGGELGTPVSSNALYAAHNRAWERLNLKKSLTEYLGNTKRMRLKPEDLIFSLDADRMKEVDKAKRFVITSALNNTQLEENVWRSLQRYAKEQEAMILIVPSRYKNPTSKAESSKENRDAWWPEEIVPYLTDDRILLHEHCYLVADVRVQATATNPLTGLESFSGPASAIYGHAQLAMSMIPVPSNRLPKVLYTTGSVSQSRYSDTKQGVRGSKSHGFGGVVLERDGSRFHIRALVSDPTGGFYDLDRYYGPKTSKKAKRALALVTGDTHAQFVDPKCADATFHNADSISAVVSPEKIVRHDMLDFAASGHHNRKDPIHKIAVHAAGMQYVEKELELTTDMLNDTTPSNAENIVIASNHNEHLMRWLKEVCAPLEEPWNANIWIELWSALKDTIIMGDGGAECGDPFALWAEKRLTVKTRFLERGESHMIGDIEVSLHGDAGTNGSRGSLTQFSKLGVRTVTGHCLTAEHDVLTPEGWAPIADVSKGTPILSYDDSTRENVWEETLEKQEFSYTGELIRIRHSGAFDQEVTPGHYIKLRDGSRVLVPEAILTRNASELPLTASPLPEGTLDMPELQIRRIVAACADGSFGEGGYLRFNLSKSRKWERLVTLFGEDLNPPGKLSKTNGSRKQSVKKDSQSYRDVIAFVVPTATGKHLPSEFLNLTPRGREIALDELEHWDGTFQSKGNGQQFSTFKEEEANLVAALITMQGYRCTMNKREDSRGFVLSWSTNRDHSYVSRKDHAKARHEGWGVATRYVTKEPTFCFTVKNTHCFWVRSKRTGLVSLTGNSHSPGIKHGAYAVGTSSRLTLSYNRAGASSWAHCHCIIHPNGKRQLVFVIDGKWRRDPDRKSI